MTEIEVLRADLEVTNLLLTSVMGALEPDTLRLAIESIRRHHEASSLYSSMSDAQISYVSLKIQGLLDGWQQT